MFRTVPEQSTCSWSKQLELRPAANVRNGAYLNSDARRASRTYSGVLLAIVGGVLILLIVHFFPRSVRDTRVAETQNVAAPWVNNQSLESRPSDSVSGMLPETLRNGRDGSRVRASSHNTDGEQRENWRASEDDDQLVRTSGSAAENGDGHRQTAISCWRTNESALKDYSFAVDRTQRTKGDASASISAIQNTPNNGQLFQVVDAIPLRGSRVQFTADMRTKGARRRAGLWLRAHDAQGRLVAMKQTLLIGSEYTTSGDIEWTTVDVVMDVPTQADVVSYGITMGGEGQAWVDNVRVEVPGSATTGTGGVESSELLAEPAILTSKPKNPDFELSAGAACR